VTSRRLLRALVDACHPGPTATVTIVVAALSAAAGRDVLGVLIMAVATLTGQLSVGWSNDAFDADRDRRAAREAKPTVRGDVSATLLWRAAGVALALTVVTSYVAAGALGGTAHVIAVASAWSYNLLLKTTVLSPLPFAVSFGLVPAFVTYGLTPPAAPAAWLTATGALLGVGAHLANAIPDVETDEHVGAGGFVARVGVRRATWLALTALLAALVLLATHLGLGAVAGTAVVVTALAGVLATAIWAPPTALFRAVLVLAVAAVGLLLVAARSLTG
jgi:4-hydroxybenzoate polyprenyltransferase